MWEWAKGWGKWAAGHGDGAAPRRGAAGPFAGRHVDPLAAEFGPGAAARLDLCFVAHLVFYDHPAARDAAVVVGRRLSGEFAHGAEPVVLPHAAAAFPAPAAFDAVAALHAYWSLDAGEPEARDHAARQTYLGGQHGLVIVAPRRLGAIRHAVAACRATREDRRVRWTVGAVALLRGGAAMTAEQRDCAARQRRGIWTDRRRAPPVRPPSSPGGTSDSDADGFGCRPPADGAGPVGGDGQFSPIEGARSPAPEPGQLGAGPPAGADADGPCAPVVADPLLAAEAGAGAAEAAAEAAGEDDGGLEHEALLVDIAATSPGAAAESLRPAVFAAERAAAAAARSAVVGGVAMADEPPAGLEMSDMSGSAALAAGSPPPRPGSEPPAPPAPDTCAAEAAVARLPSLETVRALRAMATNLDRAAAEPRFLHVASGSMRFEAVLSRHAAAVAVMRFLGFEGPLGGALEARPAVVAQYAADRRRCVAALDERARTAPEYI